MDNTIFNETLSVTISYFDLVIVDNRVKYNQTSVIHDKHMSKKIVTWFINKKYIGMMVQL